MRKYEIMYIVRPNLEEEGRKAVITNFQNEFDRLAGISEDVIRYIAIKEEA